MSRPLTQDSLDRARRGLLDVLQRGENRLSCGQGVATLVYAPKGPGGEPIVCLDVCCCATPPVLSERDPVALEPNLDDPPF
jgi:hypothetical protein